MSARDEARYLGPEQTFIGAGDEVVILSRREEGVFILVDVEGDEASLHYMDGSNAVTYAPFSDIAHPDSPVALEGGGDDA